MNTYSEDLGKKIIEALGQGMGKSKATCTFSVSLSSVKRYARMAEEGRSLAPKKRPFITFQETTSLHAPILLDRDKCVILELWSAPWSAPHFLLSTEPC